MSSLPAHLEVGKVIGDYQIVSLIGQGGMGKVFKVRNVISDRTEAMKVLLPDLDSAPELAERFQREIRVVAGLEHPNIASLRTALRVGNQLLMIMEFVEGHSLNELLAIGRFDEARAVHITSQVLNALAHAHRLGVVHRDAKPSNILVGPGDRVKLTDFGIASRTGDPKLTAVGTAIGSLYYMSPEQMKAEPIDARSDLYSVGATLYEMITGIRPVPGESFYSILKAHTETKPKPMIDLVPGITPGLSRVVEKSLEKSPAARFQTAEEFQAALHRLNSGSPSADLDETAPEPPLVLQAPINPNRTRVPNTPPRGEVPKPPSETGSKSWDPVVLETARKNLAVYIGPMAKVLVSRASKTARTTEELYRALASEITTPADREKFLRSLPF
jgi:serine/threonine-protein kinase